MTLTLRGRLETRVFLICTVGLVWTLLSASASALATEADVGPVTACGHAVLLLLAMGTLGLGWELAYHAAQQLRWDRDWPSSLALASVTNEAVLLWAVAGELPGVERGSAWQFAVRIATTWLVMWAFAQGPMKVLFIRWRLQGGRLT